MPRYHGRRKRRALEAATDFLHEVLKDGPVLVQDIKEAAKENGIAWRTIQRAKAQIPVRARRREDRGDQRQSVAVGMVPP